MLLLNIYSLQVPEREREAERGNSPPAKDSKTLRAEIENILPFSELKIHTVFRNGDLEESKPTDIFFFLFAAIVLHQILR